MDERRSEGEVRTKAQEVLRDVDVEVEGLRSHVPGLPSTLA